MLKQNRQGYLISPTERECTKCGCIFKLTSKTVTICNTCNSNRVKSTHPIKKMWQRAKNRAKDKDIDFSISLEDIIIPDVCPILGIKLKEHKGISGGRKDSPSLDRIDNSKGYIKDNIRVISHLANQMKCHSSVEEMKKFAKWVLDTYPEEN